VIPGFSGVWVFSVFWFCGFFWFSDSGVWCFGQFGGYSLGDLCNLDVL